MEATLLDLFPPKTIAQSETADSNARSKSDHIHQSSEVVIQLKKAIADTFQATLEESKKNFSEIKTELNEMREIRGLLQRNLTCDLSSSPSNRNFLERPNSAKITITQSEPRGDLFQPRRKGLGASSFKQEFDSFLEGHERGSLISINGESSSRLQT